MNVIVYSLLILLPTLANAQAKELIVIFDSGDTLPITPYLPESIRKNPSISESSGPRELPLPVLFPVTTPSMSPGTVESVQRRLPYLVQPFFLIGSDDYSKRWLLDRKTSLIKLKAIGYVINVNSLADLQALSTLAGGLRLAPISGEFFATQLKLKHYPVLISRQGWEQ